MTDIKYIPRGIEKRSAPEHGLFDDISGHRFGSLIAIEYYGKKFGRSYWLCQCDCSTYKVIARPSLKTGKAKSCGFCQCTYTIPIDKY